MKSLLYGMSIKGNNHYISGVECQDNNSYTMSDNEDSDIKVIVVADGHGGAPYRRSAIGAGYATSIMKDILTQAIDTNRAIFKNIEDIDEDLNKISNQIIKLDNVIMADDNQKLTYKASVLLPKTRIFAARNRWSRSKKSADTQWKLHKNICMDIADIEGIKKEKQDRFSEFCALWNKKDEYIQEMHNMLRNVIEKMLRKWRKAVIDHIIKNPVVMSKLRLIDINNNAVVAQLGGYANVLNDSSIEYINYGLFDSDIPNIYKNIYSIYGSTLLVAAVYGKHNIVMQIGDGVINIITDEVRRAFDEDKDGALNETTSICQSNASTICKMKYFIEKVKAITLNTDGFDGAFSDEENYANTIRATYDCIEEEPKDYVNELKILMRQASISDGDDVTFAIIANDIDDAVVDIIKGAEVTEDEEELAYLYTPFIKNYKRTGEPKFLMNSQVYRIDITGNSDDEKSIVVNVTNPRQIYGVVDKIEDNTVSYSNITKEYYDKIVNKANKDCGVNNSEQNNIKFGRKTKTIKLNKRRKS